MHAKRNRNLDLKVIAGVGGRCDVHVGTYADAHVGNDHVYWIERRRGSCLYDNNVNHDRG